VWEEWDEELERRKEEGEMYVSLMEKKGISKGRAEGRMEGKIDTARKMLAQGESDEKILYFTEITPEQLEALRRGGAPSRP
jgi:predicted transposase/invertase (TIGR01784 family)